MRPDELEVVIQRRLDAFPRPVRAELLRVLLLPDFDRVDSIGTWWANPRTRSSAPPD